MPSARKAAMHLAHSLVTICAGTTLLAALAAGCASSAIAHAPVSLAQRQAISRFYIGELWLADGSQSVGCPVDVLGVTEAEIYPESLRPLALNYMNYGGPRSLWDPAAKAAGCGHWTAPWRDEPCVGP